MVPANLVTSTYEPNDLFGLSSGNVAQTVAVSIGTSRLDYCNALYAGMSSINFNKLQRVQNPLARVVHKRRKFEHITPSLVELH